MAHMASSRPVGADVFDLEGAIKELTEQWHDLGEPTEAKVKLWRLDGITTWRRQSGWIG